VSDQPHGELSSNAMHEHLKMVEQQRRHQQAVHQASLAYLGAKRRLVSSLAAPVVVLVLALFVAALTAVPLLVWEALT